MMDIIKCINRLLPDWRGAVWGNSYEGIKPDISETRPTPTLAELEAVWPQIEAEQIAAEEAEAARIAAKAQAIIDNLPTWSQVATAIDKITTDVNAATTLAMVKPALLALVVIVKKMARVQYWMAKGTAE